MATKKKRVEEIQISLSDMTFHSDFNSDCGGIGFKWNCPKCGEEVAWAPYAWWDLKCECSDWHFEIGALGMPKAEEGGDYD